MWRVSPYVAIAASDHLAVLVLADLGLLHAAGTALDGELVGVSGVGHPDRDVDDAVPVRGDVPADVGATAHLGGEPEPGRAGLEDVLGVVAMPGLRPAVRRDRHAERGRVEVRGLFGVAHREVHVVDAFDREVFVVVAELVWPYARAWPQLAASYNGCATYCATCTALTP